MRTGGLPERYQTAVWEVSSKWAGFTEGLAAVEQIQHGIAVVAHQHQGSVGQPAAQLHDHLAGPVGELLVLASLLLVVTGRRRQHREHRQGPMASGPGHVAQPHGHYLRAEIRFHNARKLGLSG